MSLTVLALVLAAAFAHAGWNLVAKPAEGGAAFVWLCAVAGTLLYLPALAVTRRTSRVRRVDGDRIDGGQRGTACPLLRVAAARVRRR